MPVVDASVVVDWISPSVDVRSAAVLGLRRLLNERAELTVPDLLFAEVGNALLTGIRRRRWSGSAADNAFAALHQLPLHVVTDTRDVTRAWDLARRYDDHPFYDMMYVAVAERMKTQLITGDDALRRRVMLPWVVGPDAR
jgi:predicted nucleic acid-binding protein